MITVVGTGREVGDLTFSGAEAIKRADIVVVKSEKTHTYKAVQSIRQDVVTCDDLYVSAQDFDGLNEAIANRLNSYGDKNVAFCVVGQGSDDTTVPYLDGAKIVAGVSVGSAAVGGKLLPGTTVYTAADFLAASHILPVPTLIKCIDDKFVASDVVLRLKNAMGGNASVTVASGKTAKTYALDELPKLRYDYQTSFYAVPADLTKRQSFDYYDCHDVLHILRGENGCPWDREQTHRSIEKNVIEEAYELANALQNEDTPNIVEELGDLLMQVLFHLEIAADNGEFASEDVYTALCRKLIDRHPHVFGNVVARNADESLDVWNAQKLKEHKINGTAQNVADVPLGMSAIMRNQKVQTRAAKGGYEFESEQQIAGKVQEELNEFLQAKGEEKVMEGGDLLHAVISLLRYDKVDAETALIQSTNKFVCRVTECERLLALRGQNLTELSGEEFDKVWAEVKRNVG